MWQKPFVSTVAKRLSAPRLRELNMTLVVAVGCCFGLTFELVHRNGTDGFSLLNTTRFNLSILTIGEN